MSDVDCTPSREPLAASSGLNFSRGFENCVIKQLRRSAVNKDACFLQAAMRERCARAAAADYALQQRRTIVKVLTKLDETNCPLGRPWCDRSPTCND